MKNCRRPEARSRCTGTPPGGCAGSRRSGRFARQRAAVVALGYLHALEDALVLGAQLSKVSESKSSHSAVV